MERRRILGLPRLICRGRRVNVGPECTMYSAALLADNGLKAPVLIEIKPHAILWFGDLVWLVPLRQRRPQSSYACRPHSRRPVRKELWRQLQPLISAYGPSDKGGARKLAVSAALNGIRFVLHTGIPWKDLPLSFGYGSGMTCWRRLRNWNAAVVWEQLHQAMLTRLREHDQTCRSRAYIDGSSVPSPRGSSKRAPTRRTEASSAPRGISS